MICVPTVIIVSLSLNKVIKTIIFADLTEVGGPQLYVLQVQIGGGLGDMHRHAGSDAVWVDMSWRCHEPQG